MKLRNNKIKLVKSLLTALSLLLYFSVNSFSAPTLPFTDNFTGTEIGANWNSLDADNSVESVLDTNGVKVPLYETKMSVGPDVENDGDGVLFLEAYGNPTWGGEDEYAALFLDNIDGNFTAIVQVKYQEDTASNAECGIMVRNDITAVGNGDIPGEGYVTMASLSTEGYAFSYDGDDNGMLGTKPASVGVPSTQPETWLKLTKDGQTFSGYYSTDGVNWTLLKSQPRATASTIQDVGLFVYAKSDDERCTVRFDNFSIVSGTESYTHYLDADKDTYGNINVTTSTSTPAVPTGYVADNTDCNDKNEFINPGRPELCNGLDDNCKDGIDENLVGTITYFRDADNDNYGTADDTEKGCSPPDGYVAVGGDCNDNDASINPESYDECGDNIDQDCSGSDRVCGSDEVCLKIADSPLAAQVKSAPAVVMFLLDDSGSMSWDVLCPEQSGAFGGKSWVASRPNYYEGQYAGYNGVFYDPAKVYEPWVLYDNADPDKPRKHPVGTTGNATFTTSTQDLDAIFDIISIKIPFARYYTKSDIDGNVYLVTITSPAIRYYTADVGSSGQVKKLVHTVSPPSDIKVTRSYAEERQNFANWFTYYRTRELAAKAALGMVINEIENMKVGIHTINKSVQLGIRNIKIDGLADQTKELLVKLYEVDADGGTPLRKGLRDVGEYYDTAANKPADAGLYDEKGVAYPSPWASEADGGACQQAFTIALTDGYYNGKPPVGIPDADGDESSLYDREPFYHKGPVTLADVAMHYYERDLATELDDNLFESDIDPAPHQHMVTYMVSYGLEGSLKPDDACPSDPDACPDDWPNPSNDDQKIDDLWHTAVNGRGLFLTARNIDELVASLTTLMSDIDARTKTSAPVSMNTQKLESDTDLYQGFFESEFWSGNLMAYDVCTDADVLADPAICPERGFVKKKESWSAHGELININADDRVIYTLDGTSRVPFRYDNLNDDQKKELDPNTDDAKILLNYIRGDHSKEVANGGELRDRKGKLGDIVHSSPTFEGDRVYVGANDGMLHAFDAASGVEEFAFIPSRLIENLRHYADPNYAHKYFVDGKISTAVFGEKTWLVGGLGKGGRGIYGIDISKAADPTDTDLPFTWEYPAQGDLDDDMGFSFSSMSIVKSNLGDDPVIIFGNGYDSKNGRAVLYILDTNGIVIRKIDTKAGNNTTMCNGLSTPAVIDVNYDGRADFAYAGDLQGNMWKFDLTSDTASAWGVSYGGSSTPAPLFQAKNKYGEVQAITGQPDVMKHCNENTEGYIVVFGTGRYISFSDITSLETQTIYGIWDWEDSWLANGVDPSDKHFGYIDVITGSPAVRKLSNIDTLGYFPFDKDLILLEQTQTELADGWRKMTNNPISWFSPKIYAEIKAKAAGGPEDDYTAGLHVGWYFDLPKFRERVIARTQIRDGKAVVVSISPSDAPCTAGGSSVVHVINACNGGMLDEAQFDENEDDKVDKHDDPNAGKEFENDIYYAPAILEDKMYFSKDQIEDTTSETRGLHYWRMFNEN